MQDYAELMALLQYEFKDVELLQRALTHRSFKGVNNERLEYLGDAVLSVVIAESLFHQKPAAREGKLSRIRSALVNGEVLADLALKYQLDQYLRLGAGEVRSGGHARRSILADAFEAVIGAVYLDAGMEAARRCILLWYADSLKNLDDIQIFKDAKSLLQEWLQARSLPLPVYHLKTTGPAHDQIFDITCEVEGLELTTNAQGRSRRKAEQAAAQRFLDALNEQ